jgi:hypothetical protein
VDKVEKKMNDKLSLEECPWPESIWPMTEQEYVEAVPDEKLRTAISGMLMRRGWNVAMRQIKERENEIP